MLRRLWVLECIGQKANIFDNKVIRNEVGGVEGYKSTDISGNDCIRRPDGSKMYKRDSIWD